jgi:hypothetical protein
MRVTIENQQTNSDDRWRQLQEQRKQDIEFFRTQPEREKSKQKRFKRSKEYFR